MKANGFTLNGTKVNGNITFDKQEYKDSADLEKDGATVTSEVTAATIYHYQTILTSKNQ